MAKKNELQLFIARLAEKEPDGKKLAGSAVRMVRFVRKNIYSHNMASGRISGNQKAKAAFRPLSLAWVMRLGEMEKAGNFDDRNASAVKTGAALCRTGYLEKTQDPVALEFAAAMSREPRDLQQDFSAIVFHFLSDSISFWNLIKLNDAMEREGFPEWDAWVPDAKGQRQA